jgi:hypothetical protein
MPQRKTPKTGQTRSKRYKPLKPQSLSIHQTLNEPTPKLEKEAKTQP